MRYLRFLVAIPYSWDTRGVHAPFMLDGHFPLVTYCREPKLKILLLPLFLIVVAAIIAALKKRSGDQGPWPFYAKKPLSQPEQVLYHRLVKVLPEHIVLAQVQVSRVLGVKKGHNFHQWNNRINRLSYDFVVCGKDGSVIAAIELDDKSHAARDRVDTDQKKDRATAAAGVRLIRWHVKELPSAEAIQAALAPAGSQASSMAKPAPAVVPAEPPPAGQPPQGAVPAKRRAAIMTTK